MTGRFSVACCSGKQLRCNIRFKDFNKIKDDKIYMGGVVSGFPKTSLCPTLTTLLGDISEQEQVGLISQADFGAWVRIRQLWAGPVKLQE